MTAAAIGILGLVLLAAAALIKDAECKAPSGWIAFRGAYDSMVWDVRQGEEDRPRWRISYTDPNGIRRLVEITSWFPLDAHAGDEVSIAVSPDRSHGIILTAGRVSTKSALLLLSGSICLVSAIALLSIR